MYIYFLIFFGFLIIVEAILKSIWNVAYFKSGFPIYRKCRKGSIISSQVNSGYLIETLVYYRFNRFKFNFVQENYFLFKDKGFSVMHGSLSVVPATGQVIVVGRLNWYIIALIIFLVILIIDKIKANDYIFIFILLFFLMLVISDYFVERKQFDRIANIVTINLEKLQSGSKDRDFVKYHDEFFDI